MMIGRGWAGLHKALNTQAAGRMAAVIVLLLAAGLRFHLLGAQSLWNDEGASVVMAHRTLSEIATNAAADIHPPGYYVLLAGWVRLAGETEFALRMLSALESVLTVALVYALGRRLSGAGAGLMAALLLALNTFALYYAQETRMYAQLGLLAAAGMWALLLWLMNHSEIHSGADGVAWHSSARLKKTSPLKWTHHRSSGPGLRRGANIPLLAKIWRTLLSPREARYLLALALINAAGLYTQYAYPFTMLAQGAVFLLWWARRREGRALGLYVAANAMTLLLFAPWAGEAIRQVTSWPTSGAGADPATIVRTLVCGLPGAQGELETLAMASGLILAVGSLAGIHHAVSLLPTLWALIPVGAFLALRLQADDLKSLLTTAAAVALWLGMGAAALWSPRRSEAHPFRRALAAAGVLSLLGALLGGLWPLYHDPAYARDDYRTMAAAVMADAHPGDAVILDGPGQGEVWSYYYRGDAPVYPLPRDLGGDDVATRAELDAILRDHAGRRLFVLFWGEAERDPNRVVEATLDGQAFEVETRWYGDVRFVIYAAADEAATRPTETMNVRFGEHITLRGFALNRAAFRPGEALTLTLLWETDAPLDRRYKVFVHLYADPNAPPPAQRDSEPGGGLAPTLDWRPGQTITDRHGILIPADLPPGDYTLAIGLYDADDPQARLSTSAGDRLPLATVRVAS